MKYRDGEIKRKQIKMHNIIKKYFYQTKHRSYTLIKYDHSGTESKECNDLNDVLKNIVANVNVNRNIPLWFDIVPNDITKTKIAFFTHTKKIRYNTVDIAVLNQNPSTLRSDDLLKNIENKDYKGFFIADNSNLNKRPSVYAKHYFSEKGAIDLINFCDCSCYDYIPLSDGENNDGNKTGAFILNRSNEPRAYHAIDVKLNDVEGFESISNMFGANLVQEYRNKLR